MLMTEATLIYAFSVLACFFHTLDRCIKYLYLYRRNKLQQYFNQSDFRHRVRQRKVLLR
jgi:hypothetical protein